MIKYKIFVNKHLPVQTQSKELFDLFRLFNEDSIAMRLT